MRIIPYHLTPRGQRRPHVACDPVGEPPQVDGDAEEVTPEVRALFDAQARAQQVLGQALADYLLTCAFLFRHFATETAVDMGEHLPDMPDGTLASIAGTTADRHVWTLSSLAKSLLDGPLESLAWGKPSELPPSYIPRVGKSMASRGEPYAGGERPVVGADRRRVAHAGGGRP